MDDQKIKKDSESVTQKKCDCLSLQGLFIPNRQLSLVVSGCIAMLFLSFMTGYFFGGQHAAQDFMHHVSHASFNDQMSASLCALTKECTIVDAASNDDSENSIEDDSSFQECVRNNVDEALQTQEVEAKQSDKRYYAQLIGFGTQQAAQRFAKKLENQHIPVEINKHSSRTAKGKTIHWYQVITLPYDNKQKLLTLVNTIQKAEKIQDIRIIEC